MNDAKEVGHQLGEDLKKGLSKEKEP